MQTTQADILGRQLRYRLLIQTTQADILGRPLKYRLLMQTTQADILGRRLRMVAWVANNSSNWIESSGSLDCKDRELRQTYWSRDTRG